MATQSEATELQGSTTAGPNGATAANGQHPPPSAPTLAEEPARRSSSVSRCLTLAQIAAGTLLAGAAALAYATQIEVTWLQVTRRDVPLPRLPGPLDGLRIAHLTDFHRSPIVAHEYLEQCVAAALAERPDMIVLTGDFVTKRSRHIAEITPLLARLSAPHGVYAILGNHDAYAGSRAVAAALAGFVPGRADARHRDPGHRARGRDSRERGTLRQRLRVRLSFGGRRICTPRVTASW
jgi:hypothetical protein